MKIISVFNNKGGVGKSTLSFHLAHALSEIGIKTLMVDLDPQSNLTLQCIESESLEKMWIEEEAYIEDYKSALDDSGTSFDHFLQSPRSIHCLLKPIEDGLYESFMVGEIFQLNNNLGLIPGRLSLHTYEDKIAKSWSEAFMGDPQAIRLITSIRNLCIEASRKFGYQVAIIDTSPSLGILNRVIISTSTGFFVPCMPDMFSTFGIKNIGQALKLWKSQFTTMYSLLSDKKRDSFPKDFVEFLGFTVYNAKKYEGNNDFDLASTHFSYVEKIPEVISKNIPSDCYSHLANLSVKEPIGGKSVMHSHNTLATMAQKYRQPIWKIPDLSSEILGEDRPTISGNRQVYYNTQSAYQIFAKDLLERLKNLQD
jgi:cellulose biosynthesis protein BcsQ